MTIVDRSDIGENIEFETSSGNVFADIGFENAQEMLFKSELVRQINHTIKGKDLNSASSQGKLKVTVI